MDELDQRLRTRLERLADAVPVAPEPVATAAVRAHPTPFGRRGLAAAALVAVVAIALTGGLLGLSGLTASPSSSPVMSAGRTASPSTSPAPTVAPASGRPVAGQRYPDGIPVFWAGQLVHRGAEARQLAAQLSDDTPFYVAGWLTVRPGPRSCPMVPADANPWLPNCFEWSFSDSAGGHDPAWQGSISFRLVEGGMDKLANGPVIVEAHVHDARATDCAASAAACDGLIVVSSVAWAGDAVTAGTPISPTAALDAINGVDAAAALGPNPGGPMTGCGADLAAAEMLVSPTSIDRVPSVAYVYVESTTAAMDRVLRMNEGADATWYAESKICAASGSGGSSEWRWLRVANVAVVVHLSVDENAADHAFVAALASALGRAAAAGLSPAPSAAVVPCDAGSIGLSLGRSGAAAGTVGAVVRFTNTGATPCSLVGAPGVEGMSTDGSLMTAVVSDGIFGMPAGDGIAPVVLAPGTTAYAAVAGTDNPAGASPSCPPAFSSITVTLPGGDPVTMAVELPACSGIEVSPFSSVEQAP